MLVEKIKDYQFEVCKYHDGKIVQYKAETYDLYGIVLLTEDKRWIYFVRYKGYYAKQPKNIDQEWAKLENACREFTYRLNNTQH